MRKNRDFSFRPLRAFVAGLCVLGATISWAGGFDPAQTKDPYLTLGIERSASPEAVRERYHELLKRYHPDRAVLSGIASAQATAITQNLNSAYAWLKKNHVASVETPSEVKMSAKTPTLSTLDPDSVLRFAWEVGMDPRETLRAMNKLLSGNAALARIDQWFETEKAKPDFLLLYLEVTRLHPEARRLERLRDYPLAKLGSFLPRFRATLSAIARANPALAPNVNAILYPITQPKVFLSSEAIKSELRSLRAQPFVDLRRELAELAGAVGDGRNGFVGNRLFQEGVVSFIEEDFLRAEARVKPEIFDPYLNLVADDARVFELRVGLLRLAPDHGALVNGAIEAARVARGLAVLEGPLAKEYRLADGTKSLHDYAEKLANLMEAIVDADARLSNGHRASGALQEMLLNLAVRAHEGGNPDAKYLVRSMVDVIVGAGESAGAVVLERFAQGLAARRQAEIIFGTMDAPQLLQKLIRTLRGTPRSCRAFF